MKRPDGWKEVSKEVLYDEVRKLTRSYRALEATLRIWASLLSDMKASADSYRGMI